MRIRARLLLACLATASVAQSPAIAQTYAERIVGGFGQIPMFGTHVPGDANRLFVGRTWEGRISILDLTTRTVLPTDFLYIADLLPNPRTSEQGLLGIAFDPNYATNGYFYIHYTATDNSVKVVRYNVQGDPATSNIADPNSAHTILHVPKGNVTWHNSGWIDFGPNDGYFYMTLGDPSNFAQSTDNLHGKIMRVDVHGEDAYPDDPSRNFAIPPSNPFVNKDGLDEIWAWGLRNPFRADFDNLTGDLWINDVGQDTREEVNFQPADSPGGENYGWPRREGSITGPPGHGAPPSPAYVEPVYDYPHNGPDPLYRGNVIAAGGFYRGPVDAIWGFYFFSDNGSRNIWKLDPDAVDRRASVMNVNHLFVPNAGFLNRVPAFGEDAAGNMYFMDYDAAGASEIFRFATASKDIVWNGNDTSAGVAGNGTGWGDANNWTRGGVTDAAFVAQDNVVFAAGSSQPIVDLGADRTVAAMTFQAPFRLQNHALKVLSGNVFVESGVTAVIDANLSAENANQSLRKMGTGTLIVNGDAGQIAVKEGTLGGSGTLDHLTVREGATVAPGASIGILTVENSFTMHAGSTLRIELDGNDNSNPLDPEYDQVVVGGTFKANGTLEVVLFDNGNVFAPDDGDTFAVVSTEESIIGQFSDIELPTLAGGLAWEIDPTDGTSFLISATSMLRSDFNDDGVVDAADYVVWRTQAGQGGIDLAADGTGSNGMPDGQVNDLDYNFWKANFGTSVAASNAQFLRSVPEPSGLLLSCLGALGWLTRRRGHD
jgi:Glucose / Sorbosone dehydrogenase/PEP-CTERM motif